MTHTSTAAEVCHALLVLGSCWTVAWLAGDAARGWTVARRAGRRVLRVVTWRPPRVRVTADDVGVTVDWDRLARETFADERARRRARRRAARHPCARRGHKLTWDGYHEGCRRCDVRPPPGSVLLDDPRPHPHP